MSDILPTEEPGQRPVVPEAKAVADEAPVVLAIDEGPGAEEEKVRQAAWDGEYWWKGQKLLPYTPTKRGLWERLCALDVPLPRNVELMNLEAYAPQCLKLLYLLTHPAEEYAALRGNPGAFLAEIERWVDATVKHEELLDAVVMALKVHNDALASLAVPKPATGKGAGHGAGE